MAFLLILVWKRCGSYAIGNAGSREFKLGEGRRKVNEMESKS
jgi:hypothetical protein